MSPFQHRNPAIQVPPLQQQQPQQFGVPYDMNGYGYPAGQQGGYYYGPSDGYRDRFYKTPFLRKTFKINLHYQFFAQISGSRNANYRQNLQFTPKFVGLTPDPYGGSLL
jgi:hypothetical protein